MLDMRIKVKGCPGKLYTNLDATEVIRTSEHAEGCRVDGYAFYHQQLSKLKKLAAEDLRSVSEIYAGLMMSWKAMPPPAQIRPLISYR
ncbi:hypothetical protein T4A_3379 [Trichinella pseudospiralis]|uniref:Uncharacterized protein n=1 Tax=Trichinella pseudospiralis TaxID=6337 RepID=A0A0V1DXR8_TRIPS|nr:hypothetical protein T4A_3379 [Trichinella pseudospiralis]